MERISGEIYEIEDKYDNVTVIVNFVYHNFRYRIHELIF